MLKVREPFAARVQLDQVTAAELSLAVVTDRLAAGSSVGTRVASLAASDNPRSEDPAAIVAAIRSGIPAGHQLSVELDRARAIERAVLDAGADDLVILAGKGHELVQTSTSSSRSSDSDLGQAAHARRIRGSG